MSVLPLKYTPRHQQSEILNFFKKSVANNKKFILLDAPTGSGKSFLPTLLGNWFLKTISRNTSIDVITQTKSLQRQYKDDFDHMGNLYGQSNYFCQKNATSCDNAKMLNESGKHCSDCPYKAAMNNFLNSDIALCNYHLFNSFQIFISEFWEQFRSRPKNILFVDEAHLFEKVFSDFISNRISVGIMKRLDLDTLDNIEQFESIRSVKATYNFLKSSLIPDAHDKLGFYRDKIRLASNKNQKSHFAKKYDYLDSFINRWGRFMENHDDGNWVINTEYTSNQEKVYSIEPIWGREYINEFIWDKYDHIVLMSGSILDPKIFSKLNGFSDQNYSYLKLKHVFPAKKRPIFYLNKGKMSQKHLKKSFNQQVPLIRKILKRHKNHKGIIHTANYKISDMLVDAIGSNRFITHDSENRDEQLQKHINSKSSTIMVSPSMFTGVDLKDDLSRFQIIMKIPFPYLGSNKIKRRMKQEPDWYAWKTINDLVQSYGRSIRSKQDWAYTYFLDGSFDFLYQKNKKLIPKYFMDGISAGAKHTSKK